MTRPTSRLEWFPDPLNPLAIRAIWIGAGWHYTVFWGDGTSQRVLFTQPPVRHVYPAAGTYTLTAVSEINKVQVSMQVVVRPQRSPEATLDDLGGGWVRLRLTAQPDPVLHRVDWGDDSPVQEYSGTQLNPEHTYPPGTTEPLITVTDVPARRSITLIGPVVPPEPPPGGGPATTWRPDLTTPGAGTLDLTGFPPRTRVTVGGTWEDPAEFDLITDGDGRAHRDVVLWATELDPNDPKNPRGHLDFWQSIELRWAQEGRTRQMWQPVNWCEWTEGGCWFKPQGPNEKPVPVPPQNRIPLLLDWDTDHPAVITISVAPARNGPWHINWGNGQTQDIEVTDGRFTATYDYGRYGSHWITVTDPAERVGRRRVRPIKPRPTTWNDGSLAIFQAYEAHSSTPGEIRDCDSYGVMRVDAGDGRPLRQIHRPAIHCSDSSAIGFSYTAPGDYTVTMYGPMSDPITYVHHQKVRDIRGRREYPITPAPAAPELTAEFAVTTPGQDGYGGEFTVTHHGTAPVAAWRVEFRLPAPAAVAALWPPTASLDPLGGGRYALTSDTNLQSGQSTKAGIRVESAGDPPVLPDDIRATATKGT